MCDYSNLCALSAEQSQVYLLMLSSLFCQYRWRRKKKIVINGLMFTFQNNSHTSQHFHLSDGLSSSFKWQEFSLWMNKTNCNRWCQLIFKRSKRLTGFPRGGRSAFERRADSPAARWARWGRFQDGVLSSGQATGFQQHSRASELKQQTVGGERYRSSRGVLTELSQSRS